MRTCYNLAGKSPGPWQAGQRSTQPPAAAAAAQPPNRQPSRGWSERQQPAAMDLAVTLPLAALLLVQLLLSALLLAPRALSRHVAALLALSRSSPVVQAVVATVAVAVLAITGSSLIQFWGVSAAMSSQQFGDRVMALTVEELRALLALVLGSSNLALLFVNRALAAEQQAADKAQLNLAVLQKQAKGLQTEYLRATSAPDGGGGGGAAGRDAGGKSEVSKLIADKHRLQEQLEGAQQELRSAQTNAAAVKAQSQGLEREYDRLLAENDALKKRLSRAGDAQYSFADKKKA